MAYRPCQRRPSATKKNSPRPKSLPAQAIPAARSTTAAVWTANASLVRVAKRSRARIANASLVRIARGSVGWIAKGSLVLIAKVLLARTAKVSLGWIGKGSLAPIVSALRRRGARALAWHLGVKMLLARNLRARPGRGAGAGAPGSVAANECVRCTSSNRRRSRPSRHCQTWMTAPASSHKISASPCQRAKWPRTSRCRRHGYAPDVGVDSAVKAKTQPPLLPARRPPPPTRLSRRAS